MADIEIEIDGKKLTAESGQMVIQVADAAGIYIPRFCYHKHLSIAANCRMCLVEVEKSPKTLPACATPVAAGMKVFTRSAKTIEAQRAVMEFLLINHPLDCPICDQGGECELQDLAMGYGSSESHYDECKRAVVDENLGPLIATEMTRCILCTRCVRFGDEIAGARELGTAFRGGHAEIRTFIGETVTSEVSGNIIDLCPVGALTSKPYRFTARAWELDQKPSIAPHDCLGTNINVHTLYGVVKRVVSRENQAINETWVSDRDRYAYTGLYHAERLGKPLAKINGSWEEVDWQQALEMAAAGMRGVIEQHGAEQLGALASPSSTTEELYLLQKLMRGLGSNNIDHRLRETDTSDHANWNTFPGLGMPLAELDNADAIILIGSNIQKEQPLAALRVRKASLRGAAIMAVNPVDYAFNFKLAAKSIIAPHQLVNSLAAIVNALQAGAINHVTSDKHAEAIAEQLRGKQRAHLILGALALHHPQASIIRTLTNKIAALSGATVSMMTDGANTAGAWFANAVMGRSGLNAAEMLMKPRKGYLLLNVEPELDCANAAQVKAALVQADFVIAMTMYHNPVLETYANIILPMAAFTETSGTYVNAAGDWQSFSGAAKAYQSSRPAWKILRVLGNFLNIDHFNYESSEEVKHEVKTQAERLSTAAKPTQTITAIDSSPIKLSRIGEIPIYAIDNLVRHALPLQEAQTLMQGSVAIVRMHPDTIKKCGLQPSTTVTVRQGSAKTQLPLQADTSIAVDAAWIPAGIDATVELGELFGEVSVTAAAPNGNP